MIQDRIGKLIAEFAAAARKHYEATMQGNWQETNKQAKRVASIFREIVDNGESARQALLALADSEDLAVAKTAAAFSLKYDPEQAGTVLRRIAKEPGMIGFVAEQALKRWEEGDWHLE